MKWFCKPGHPERKYRFKIWGNARDFCRNGTGYTGVELLRILLRHPKFEFWLHVQKQANQLLICFTWAYRSSIFRFKYWCIKDVVFFATPHGVAMQHAKEQQGLKLLIWQRTSVYKIFWKMVWHGTCVPRCTKRFGLTELNREKIKQAQVIGNVIQQLFN